jgi:cell division protein FtsB
MNVDYQTLYNVASAVCLMLIGWLGNQLWTAVEQQRTAVEQQRKELSHLREELPKTYITKDDFKDGVDELKRLLIAIDSKLDRKVDKG